MKTIKKFINKLLKRNTLEYYVFTIKNHITNLHKTVSFNHKKDLLNYVKHCVDNYFDSNNKDYWDTLDENLIYNYLDKGDILKAIKLFNYNVGRSTGIEFQLRCVTESC